MWIIAVSFFVVCIAAVIYITLRNNRKIHLISTLPGPSLFSALKIAFIIGFCDYSQVFKIVKDLFHTYGSIVSGWYGPIPLILLKDPQRIEKLCKQDKVWRRFPDIIDKKVMEPIFKGGILAIEGEEWKRHRRILNNAFHNNILGKFVNNLDKNSNILANRIEEYANGSFQALQVLFTQCTIDIVVENLFGYTLDTQKRNDVALVENLEGAVDIFSRKIFKPWMFIQIMFNMSEASRKQASIVSFLHGMIKNVIDYFLTQYETMTQNGENIEEYMKTKGRLMDFLLNSSELSRDDVIGEITSVTGAGAETSSTACCFALALLCENQDIQERVMKEQINIFNKNMHCPVANEHLIQMTYLEQVVKETLRLYPTLPHIYKNTVDEVDLGNGEIIPEGSLVVISAYVIHRDKDYFPNPDKFDPDRFTPENSVGRHLYSYIPFGLGRRMCVGHKFAMMEIKTILSTVIRRYHFIAVDGGMERINESLQLGIVMKPPSDFKFKFVPRKLYNVE
ncbi:cytochrome P450 4C1-like [Periplaneta americana]|uniref:cytochrome P450 4C1-like n=1 Tax=Periplaneta americana TaxID=6978 RepID=UPI0037E9C549